MKLTTGNEFQGYFITEYYDVIFDEMIMGIGIGNALKSSFDNFASAVMGSEATVLVERLNIAKEELRGRIIKKAQKLGANALIGIDFESSRIGELLMVSMTATAVYIEKIVSELPMLERDQKIAMQKELEEKKRQEQLAFRECYQNNQLEFKSIIDRLDQLDNAKEMMNTIREIGNQTPGLFTPDILDSLDKSVELGRMYGKKVGANDFRKKIREYLNI